MSTALTQAIYERLAGIEVLTGDALQAQSLLATLLATDPETGKPAVSFTMTDDGGDVLFDRISFRPNMGTESSLLLAQVDNPIYDLEVWSDKPRSDVITDICGCLFRLLDMREHCDGTPGAPPIDLSEGFCEHAEPFMPLIVIFDHQRRAWCGLTRWKFVEGR